MGRTRTWAVAAAAVAWLAAGQALAEDDSPLNERLRQSLYGKRRRRGWRTIRAFLFGLIAGFAALFAVLWIVASRLPH